MRRRGILPTIFLTYLIVRLRRPDQFSSPGIWAETGVLVLPQYLSDGLRSLFIPLQGYLNTSSRLIDIAAFKISFLYYPQLSAAFSLLFIIGVMLAVLLSPTQLKLRPVCVLAALLVPTDPETFGVGLYSFWWGSLLLFLVLIWETNSRKLGLRIFYLLLGGLSTPVIVPLSLMLVLRAGFERTRTEIKIAVLALSLSAVQLVCFFCSPTPFKTPTHFGLSGCLDCVERFFGFYVGYGWINKRDLFWVGLALFVFLAFSSWRRRKKLGRGYFFLAACFLVTLLMGVARTGPFVIDPLTAGPRYFFLPFILLSWLILWQLPAAEKKRQQIFIAILVTATIRGLPLFSRRHDAPFWKENVKKCMASETYLFPVFTDGKTASHTQITLRGKDCVRLVNDSLFGR